MRDPVGVSHVISGIARRGGPEEDETPFMNKLTIEPVLNGRYTRVTCKENGMLAYGL